MLAEFGFTLKNERFVDSNVPVHEGNGDTHENVLVFAIVVVRHLAIQLIATVLDTELEAKDAQVPRHAQTKAILELLQDFGREQRHVPSAVQFNARAHGKHDQERVFFTKVLGQVLVDALHVSCFVC